MRSARPGQDRSKVRRSARLARRSERPGTPDCERIAVPLADTVKSPHTSEFTGYFSDETPTKLTKLIGAMRSACFGPENAKQARANLPGASSRDIRWQAARAAIAARRAPGTPSCSKYGSAGRTRIAGRCWTAGSVPDTPDGQDSRGTAVRPTAGLLGIAVIARDTAPPVT